VDWAQPEASILTSDEGITVAGWWIFIMYCEKLTVTQLVRKFSAVYGMRRFVTTFIIAHD